MTATQHAPVAGPQLATVWGDTVDLRHLWRAVIIGAGLSLVTYYGAVATFKAFGTVSAIDHAYAMLFGLGGCIISGVTCAWLFPPKRIFIEGSGDHGERDAAIDALFQDGARRGSALPDAVRAELVALELGALQVDEPGPRLTEGG